MDPQYLKIFRDGSMWCVLIGENLRDGHAGFGATILEAIKDFDDRWRHPYAPGGEKYQGIIR